MMKAKTAPTAIPKRRNGRHKSQTTGKKIRASTAIGQLSANKRHHNKKVNKNFIASIRFQSWFAGKPGHLLPQLGSAGCGVIFIHYMNTRTAQSVAKYFNSPARSGSQRASQTGKRRQRFWIGRTHDGLIDRAGQCVAEGQFCARWARLNSSRHRRVIQFATSMISSPAKRRPTAKRIANLCLV